ncbi:MAG: 8-amino-7-oxononanoate synthase [Succinivibrio sp.]|nr:8-amino-7-oxononanoate synthase [Succinivibrio sp.]
MRDSTCLETLRREHLLRYPHTLSSAPGRTVQLEDGREVLLFCSNSYLSLNRHPKVVAAASATLEHYGCGSAGSRLVSGTTVEHQALEREIAQFKGSEAALLCGSGFMANLAVLSALTGPEEVIFSDDLNHASIIDGCRLSKAQIVVYRHCDLDDLRDKMQRLGSRRALIVTDAVFSMDGDLAPLPELAQLSRDYRCPLVVDDAHATGVLGPNGRGSLEHFHLSHSEVAVVMATLSKAIPAQGGALCLSGELRELLANTARPYIFSTSLPPELAAAARAAVALLEEDPSCVSRLRDNCRIFREYLSEQGLDCPGITPIVPIVVGSEERAAQLANQLLDEHILVSAIRYPAVARGKARLRFTVNAAHTPADLEQAALSLARALRRLPL